MCTYTYMSTHTYIHTNTQTHPPTHPPTHPHPHPPTHPHTHTPRWSGDETDAGNVAVGCEKDPEHGKTAEARQKFRKKTENTISHEILTFLSTARKQRQDRISEKYLTTFCTAQMCSDIAFFSPELLSSR
jgi:hypothetical protein